MALNDLEPKPPKMQLSDIFIPSDKAKQAIENQTNNSTSSTLGEPSMILGDWLYLGNRYHAKSREILEQLQITHVLNITATIPCSFPDIIQYAQIKVFDESTVKLYDYFEAAASYIDLCNPLNYDINCEPNKRRRKILVHCAMGISRSATITISYLMSRSNLLNKSEQKLLDHIQTNLEALDKEIESKINETNSNGWSPKIFEQHRLNKDWTKRVRKKYKKYQIVSSNQTLPLSVTDEKEKEKEKENGQDGGDDEDTKMEEIDDNNYENDKICNGFTLGEGYLFVLERRNVICPNVGFCRQLEIWEKYVWDYNDSTLYQIPFFRPDLDDINGEKNGKSKNGKSKNRRNRNNGDGDDNYQCNEQCCIIL